MFKSSTNDSFVMKHEIKCDSLRANEIYAEKINGPTSTVDFTIIDSITGHIDNFTCFTGHIDNFSSDTGEIGTLISNRIVAATGEIGTLNANRIVAATGEIGTFISNRIVAATGEIGTLNANTIYASTGIYSASSFTRDQSTGITVPNISSMYQYLATGPTSVTITNETYTRVNSLLGSVSIIGSAIPASAFGVGSLFEFYFAGSFIPTIKSENLVVGLAKMSALNGPNQVWWGSFVSSSSATPQNSAAYIQVSCTSQIFPTFHEETLYNKKLRLQSTNNFNKYQVFDIGGISYIPKPSYLVCEFSLSGFTTSSSGGDFNVDEEVIVKFDEDPDPTPAINVNLTFTQSGNVSPSDNFFCQTNLLNTIYYTKPHSFSAKSVFHVIANHPGSNTDTISIVSSNSGSILINDNTYSNSVNRPFNIYEKSVSQNSVSFPRVPTSNTVYPHILFYTKSQDILLTVNNYYLRRIA